MRAAFGEIVARILEELEQHGPMTRTELCEALKYERGNLSSIVTRLHRSGRVHVHGWVEMLGDGTRRYPRAVYAAGPGIDKNRPKRERLAARRRYEKKLKANAITSVFDLGLTREQLRARKAQKLQGEQ